MKKSFFVIALLFFGSIASAAEFCTVILNGSTVSKISCTGSHPKKVVEGKRYDSYQFEAIPKLSKEMSEENWNLSTASDDDMHSYILTFRKD